VREGETLLGALSREGWFVEAPCGGLGRCGLCAVRVEAGPLPAGSRHLACRVDRPGEYTVRRARPIDPVPVRIPRRRPTGRSLGLAVDLGTTTVAAALVDPATGRVIRAARETNPQRAYGAEVLSRVRSALSPDHRPRLAELSRHAVLKLLAGLLSREKAALADLRAARLCGNASMTLLFLGRDPERAAVPPYEPGLAAEGAIAPPPDALPLPAGALALFLPALGGHVGSDTTAAVLAAGLLDGPSPALLLDLGTNGEVALAAKGALLVASAAAGPAFEGGGIGHGSPAVAGAVEAVSRRGAEFSFRTVGGTPPRTWCGSGALDLLAALLDGGFLEASGRFQSLPVLPIPFDQADVRELQLAKGALGAAVTLLLREAGLGARDLVRVVLTGAFGAHADPGSARRIGLIPPGPPAEALDAGALRGAALALRPDGLDRAAAIAGAARHVPLGDRPDFESVFAECMALRELVA
jgi:uncharacterized 2Fe-2S/4Fe-4S cluster protein (DUF4445 family)